MTNGWPISEAGRPKNGAAAAVTGSALTPSIEEFDHWLDLRKARMILTVTWSLAFQVLVRLWPIMNWLEGTTNELYTASGRRPSAAVMTLLGWLAISRLTNCSTAVPASPVAG